MKKRLNKFTKLLILAAMIVSDLISPTMVLADVIDSGTPNKGDVGIGNVVQNDGNSATVSVGSLVNDGDVMVTKTVSKTDTMGRYKVDFEIKGKDIKQKPKPVYVVVVFDKSGSMEDTCSRYEYSIWGRYCVESDNKWESAVGGAKSFANTLLNEVSDANLALVTFSGDKGYSDRAYNDASVIRDFSNSNFDDIDFGTPNGGTNLYAGLYEANNLLSKVDSDALKYVVVISDGEPTFYYDNYGYTRGDGSITDDNTYNSTMGMANTIKSNSEVFTIGYMLPNGSVYNGKSAEDILREVASSDSDDIKHYVNGKPDDIATTFINIANDISTSEAGYNAMLTDNMGNAFKVTDTGSNVYTSDVIPSINKEGSKISFYIDINQDSETGWYNTNDGFKLEYTDNSGNVKELKCDDNPQVYWVQNTYDYVVNYYKDSFDNSNLIKIDTRNAPAGSVINESNVDRDKYLPEGYEFNTMNPNSITVNKDGNSVINILYTIKKFNYIVNYYYDNVLDNSLIKSDIPYGTSVDSKDYYLSDKDIKKGYGLDTEKSDKDIYTIKDNSVVIDIYYKKNSYGYTVNYFFNEEKGFNTDNSAIYGDKITAKSKWLSNDELNSNNKSGYFLDPNRDKENNSEITIDTDKDKNVLNIYYINTSIDNSSETIAKVANTKIVSSSNDKVSYNVKYSNKINNVRNGDIVKVTIVDKLPSSIILSDSDLNGGIYNSDDNTITWVKSYNISEYSSNYSVNEEIGYSVKYENYLKFNGNNLVNTAKGVTTVSHKGLDDKVSSGKEDSASTPVKIMGTVNVYYKDVNGYNISSKDELGEKLPGTSYETTAKSITGYTLKEEPTNKNGKYIEGNIDVIYVYTKNDGNITENELTKEGTISVSSVNDTFSYNLKYNSKIEDYVGKANLTITDTLPLEGTIISMDNRCTFSDNTIVCTKEYDVDGTLSINEEFKFVVRYNNITSDKIVNTAKSKLTLENISKEDDDKTETEVYKGNVISTYTIDSINGTKLTEDVLSSGLGGTTYNTDKKSFYGYTLKEIKGNESGKYTANETIYVNYIYSKNDGDVTHNDVDKIQNNVITDINSSFNYTLSYSGKIDNYVGDVTLILTDILPYDADIIEMDKKCNIENGTIICKDIYNIDENSNVINASYNIVLKYRNVGKIITNGVTSTLIYGNNNITDDDEVTDEIPNGKVISTYSDTDGNIISDSVTSTGLVGNNYNTSMKEIDGYTLKEIKGNESGKYIDGTLYVDYIYSKSIGNGDVEEMPPKTGVEDNYLYGLWLFGFVLLLGGYVFKYNK